MDPSTEVTGPSALPIELRGFLGSDVIPDTDGRIGINIKAVKGFNEKAVYIADNAKATEYIDFLKSPIAFAIAYPDVLFIVEAPAPATATGVTFGKTKPIVFDGNNLPAEGSIIEQNPPAGGDDSEQPQWSNNFFPSHVGLLDLVDPNKNKTAQPNLKVAIPRSDNVNWTGHTRSAELKIQKYWNSLSDAITSSS